MKTQNKKLEFKKDSIIELNDRQLIGIEGGGSVGVSISFHEITSVVIPIPVISILIDID